MAQFNAKNAQVHVFTEKEGMLSAMAHDLQIEVTDFSVTADDASVQATLNGASMKIMHALKDGQPTTALSDKDKGEIAANITKDVLKNGDIKFASTKVTKDGGGATIEGNLTLNGQTKPVQVAAKLQGANYVAEVSLNQPDYGIKPFSAMLGTLKVKPVIKIRVTLPKW
jgi:hypothetical protein